MAKCLIETNTESKPTRAYNRRPREVSENMDQKNNASNESNSVINNTIDKELLHSESSDHIDQNNEKSLDTLSTAFAVAMGTDDIAAFLDNDDEPKSATHPNFVDNYAQHAPSVTIKQLAQTHLENT